jgi:spore germination protein KC
VNRHNKSIMALFLLVLFLTGCKDIMEIDRITFPVALGIDWDEKSNMIKIHAQISALPPQSNGQQQTAKTYKVIEGQGETLVKAMTDITDHSQQYISWKHVIVVVITNKMAEHGIIGELDHLIRLEQTRLNCYLLLTDENLNDLLEATPKIASGLSTPLAGMSLINELNAYSKIVTIRDFIMPYLSKEAAPVIPLVSIYKKEEKQQQKEIELEYKGLGVFRNGRLTGRLDKNTTMGLLLVSGIHHQGSSVIPYPENNQDKSISIIGLHTKTKIIPSLQQNKPGMKVKIQATYDIAQVPVPRKMDMEEIYKINLQVQSYINKEVEAVIKKAQTDLKADIFGLGGEIYRKYPDYWLKNEDNWQEIFPTVTVEVEVEAQLDNTGDLTNSFEYMFGKD